MPHPRVYGRPKEVRSSTTGVVALKAGKSFIGIERDSRDFDVAVKRIKEAAEAAQTELIKVEWGSELFT